MLLNLFKRKCDRCRERNKIVHVEETRIFDVVIKEYYCEKCNSLRLKTNEMIGEFEKIRKEEELAKDKEQARFDYLKREVERVEIERKAKEYGITYSEH